jgi:citrate lyase subunit beta/citryl-CoA lyase
MRCRSVLFTPGNRLELLEKAGRWNPDVVVVDLEDAIPAGQKEMARQRLEHAALNRLHCPVLVRVNPDGTPWHDADVDAAVHSGAAGVVLPKAEAPERVAALARRLADHGAPALMLGIETARGIAAARELMVDGVTGAYFGAEDYIADVGGRRTAAGLEVLYARSAVVVAARLAGIPAVDQAVVALNDDEAFRVDAEAGRDLGYAGKLCIHPGQVALAHAAFTPGEDEVAAARRVVAAARNGVGIVDGMMVDAVHLRAAEQVLAQANPAADDSPPAPEAGPSPPAPEAGPSPQAPEAGPSPPAPEAGHG